VAAGVAVVAVAATGAGLLVPGADLGDPARRALRIGGIVVAVLGLAALVAPLGGRAYAGWQLPSVLATAAGVVAAVVVLTLAHSDVTTPEGTPPPATSPERQTTSSLPTSSTTSTTRPVAEEPGDDAGPGRLIAILALVLALATVAGALGVRAWQRGWRLTRPRVRIEAADPLPVAADAAEAGLGASLDVALEPADGEPEMRGRIVAAYARLLDALAEAGGPRLPQEAPHEHLDRVLGPLGVRPGPLHELAALFVLARFSTHPVTGEHRAAAVAALEAAIADLRTGAPARPAEDSLA
jgi:hypothetical protein